MKTIKSFNIWDYNKECPLAKAVENTLNTCSPQTEILEKLKGVFTNDDKMYVFFLACLNYWGHTQYYDARNRTAVLVSREFVKKFPDSPVNNTISEDVQKEAYGFTLSAHRYLQQQLFNVIMRYLRDAQRPEEMIYDWYSSQEFVIDTVLERAVPYREYRLKY